jgi:hypothetical protein
MASLTAGKEARGQACQHADISQAASNGWRRAVAKLKHKDKDS